MIDTLVPLILAHPDLVLSSRRGSVHVRRKPLPFSGRTHFRANTSGSVVVIRSLDPDALRRCLLSRARGLGGGAPTRADFDDFPAAVWLRQRLRDRRFVGLSLEPDRDGAAARGAPARAAPCRSRLP